MKWPTQGIKGNMWNLNAHDFTKLIADNPNFWLRDFALKYLTIHIDTRSSSFRLYDRDKNEISPDRVVAAIAQWKESFK